MIYFPNIITRLEEVVTTPQTDIYALRLNVTGSTQYVVGSSIPLPGSDDEWTLFASVSQFSNANFTYIYTDLSNRGIEIYKGVGGTSFQIEVKNGPGSSYSNFRRLSFNWNPNTEPQLVIIKTAGGNTAAFFTVYTGATLRTVTQSTVAGNPAYLGSNRQVYIGRRPPTGGGFVSGAMRFSRYQMLKYAINPADIAAVLNDNILIGTPKDFYFSYEFNLEPADRALSLAQFAGGNSQIINQTAPGDFVTL